MTETQKMTENKEELYVCDPNKNKDCKKTACFIYGGPCRLTKQPEFAFVAKNGQPIRDEQVRQEMEMNYEKHDL